MKPLVLYHGGCFDGFASAWVAHKALGDVEAVPVNYGQEPPGPAWSGGRQVYVLDFSYARETMVQLAQTNNQVVVLDHHKTAQAALADLEVPGLTVVFDMNKSGGRLAWEHFFPGQPTPGLVDYTEDRDLWRWNLPGSKAVNACLRSYPFDFKLWDEWGKQSPLGLCELFVEEGQAILRREQQIVEQHVHFARETEMDGHKVLAVNATVLTSEIAGELAKGRPFGACWFKRADNKEVWSLRSREGGVDVSEIAKKRGGGGHKQAAGFEV